MLKVGSGNFFFIMTKYAHKNMEAEKYILKRKLLDMAFKAELRLRCLCEQLPINSTARSKKD